MYEPYFQQKFHEDGIYSASEYYFLDLVSKHIKPIEYDRWSDLHWKAQLKGDLSAAGEQELAALENKNMAVIDKVYRRLRDDKEIQAQIEKIKGHEWVWVVEGREE